LAAVAVSVRISVARLSKSNPTNASNVTVISRAKPPRARPDRVKTAGVTALRWFVPEGGIGRAHSDEVPPSHRQRGILLVARLGETGSSRLFQVGLDLVEDGQRLNLVSKNAHPNLDSGSGAPPRLTLISIFSSSAVRAIRMALSTSFFSLTLANCICVMARLTAFSALS
jgi:hypothetical protein